jgi:hypothetical protein
MLYYTIVKAHFIEQNASNSNYLSNVGQGMLPFVLGSRVGFTASFSYLVTLHLASGFSFCGCGYNKLSHSLVQGLLVGMCNNLAV